jgi:AMP phosphorylase
MKLKAKLLGMESGGSPVVVLNVEDAQDLGIRSDSRVWLQFSGKERIAIVNIAERAVEEGSIGVFDEVAETLNIENGSTIVVEVAKFPK